MYCLLIDYLLLYWLLNHRFSSQKQAEAMLDLLELFNWRRVAVVYTSDPYGNSHKYRLILSFFLLWYVNMLF